MFRVRTAFLWVWLVTGYSLVVWVGHGLQSCGLGMGSISFYVWLRVGFWLRFVGLGWVLV